MLKGFSNESRVFCPHTKMGKYVSQAAQAVAGVNGEGNRHQEVLGTGFFTRLEHIQCFVSARHVFSSWRERNGFQPNRKVTLPNGKEIFLRANDVIDLGAYLE